MCKYPAAASFVVASAQVGDVSFVLLLVVAAVVALFFI